MAIYHANIKTISRSKGHSSIAAAAYRAGLLLSDERTGQRHDYRRRDGVVETRCMAPVGSPAWALDPHQLWVEAERAERRKDSTVAREFEFALPHELDEDQRSSLATDVTRALVERYGFAAQASIHSPGSKGGLNHHVHILATTRRIGPDGLTDKTRELDGGPTGREEVEWVRALVASSVNAHLEAAGIDARVDHRTLKVQAEEALARGDLAAAAVLSRQPTRHLGKSAAAMLRRGLESGRAEINEQIASDNLHGLERIAREFDKEAWFKGQGITAEGHGEQPSGPRKGKRVRIDLANGGGEVELSPRMLVKARDYGLFGSDPADQPPLPERVTSEELLQGIVEMWRELVSAGAVAALTWTGRVVEHASAGVSVFVDSSAVWTKLRELLRSMTQLKHRLSTFSRREQAERRAIRLVHMAEQSWEEFNTNHPRPGCPWPEHEWRARRARRLVALEKRSAELEKARKLTTPEEKVACDASVLESQVRLEACSEALASDGLMEVLPSPAGNVRDLHAIDSPVSPPGLRPSPRFH